MNKKRKAREGTKDQEYRTWWATRKTKEEAQEMGRLVYFMRPRPAPQREEARKKTREKLLAMPQELAVEESPIRVGDYLEF